MVQPMILIRMQRQTNKMFKLNKLSIILFVVNSFLCRSSTTLNFTEESIAVTEALTKTSSHSPWITSTITSWITQLIARSTVPPVADTLLKEVSPSMEETADSMPQDRKSLLLELTTAMSGGENINQSSETLTLKTVSTEAAVTINSTSVTTEFEMSASSMTATETSYTTSTNSDHSYSPGIPSNASSSTITHQQQQRQHQQSLQIYRHQNSTHLEEPQQNHNRLGLQDVLDDQQQLDNGQEDSFFFNNDDDLQSVDANGIIRRHEEEDEEDDDDTKDQLLHLHRTYGAGSNYSLNDSDPALSRQRLHGAASLAFVFDTTGSMHDDLVQVIDGAAKILATTLAMRDKPLYNYILVPFHDPDVGPVTVTTDPFQFQDALRDLSVQGGGDCPEMSIGGIKAALEAALPYSFIYVFTDARAKDFHLTDEVLTLIQTKQSQVMFVMTGDCGNTSHEGFKAYEKIASTSFGQVFLVKKSQVKQILNFVRSAVRARRVNLMSVDRPENETLSTYELLVESQLKEFTVSVSGDSPTLNITDPDGKMMTAEDGLLTLVSMKKLLVVNVKNPRPGPWNLHVGSSGPSTVRVSGLSSMDFTHGFSHNPTLNISETETRPIRGLPVNILVNTNGLTAPGRLAKLELVDMSGETLSEIPTVYNSSNPSLYNISSLLLPDDFFYVKVLGTDSKGYSFQRLSPTAVRGREPDGPLVTVSEETRSEPGNTVVLICYVTSTVPFYVDWFKNENQQLGNQLFYSDTNNVSWTIRDVSSIDHGSYTCNATNAGGFASATTFLQVSDTVPEILEPTKNISTPLGRSFAIQCIVRSDGEYNVTWFRRRTRSSKFEELGQGQEIGASSVDEALTTFDNGSFFISSVEVFDAGEYTCQASNNAGSSERTITVMIQEAPRIRVEDPNVRVQSGDTAQLICVVEGDVSNTEVTWILHNKQGMLELGTSTEVKSSGEVVTLKLKVVDEASAGDYECVASNEAGRSSATTQLRVGVSPTISNRPVSHVVNIGDNLTLTCEAAGRPPPVIRWTRRTRADLLTTVNDTQGWTEDTVINNSTSSRMTLFDNGTTLFLENVDKTDEGQYTCTATNMLDSVSSRTHVTVTGIVQPVMAQRRVHLESAPGRDVVLSCPVLLEGNPRPTISWSRTDGKVIRTRESVLPLISPGLPRDEENDLRQEEMERELRLENEDEDDSRLLLTDIKEDDDGEYMCTASNSGGTAAQSLTLRVIVAPNITSTQSEYSAVEGGLVRLLCRTTGQPKPVVRWTKNNQPIAAEDPRYHINDLYGLDILQTDAGDDLTVFTCIAINEAGVDQHSMIVNVQKPPRITDVSDNERTVTINSPAQLSCLWSAEPQPTVTWYKDGHVIDVSDRRADRGDDVTGFHRSSALLGEDEMRLEQLNSGALRINRVTINDAGEYECHVTNIAGTATKQIMLNVQVPPSLLLKAPPVVAAILGQKVTLPCHVTGYPPPSIRWQKNAEKLDDSHLLDLGYSVRDLESRERSRVQSLDGSLTIGTVQARDSGRFLCIAENPSGVVSQEIVLNVHEWPYFLDALPSEVSVVESHSISLSCPALGNPSPRITWYRRDGVGAHTELTGNELDVRILADGTLMLNHVTASSATQYICKAENSVGAISHNTTLSVYLSPRFDKSKNDETIPVTEKINEHHPLVLHCDITISNPPPQFIWYKDGHLLEVPAVVDPLYDMTDIVELGEGRRLLDKGSRLEIIESSSRDVGRYTCIARNIAGETKKNFDVEVNIAPRFIDSPPSFSHLSSPFSSLSSSSSSSSSSNITERSVSVLQDRSVSLECHVMGHPIPRLTWQKDDRDIPVSDHRLKVGGQRLDIRSAASSDGGKYTCVASNVAGETRRDQHLDVLVPVSFQDSHLPKNIDVQQNDSFSLRCPATGNPSPIITWHTPNGAIISAEGGEQRMDRNDFIVNEGGIRLDVESADVMAHSGRYTCKADNKIGVAEKHFNIIVLDRATIDRRSVNSDVTALINTTATLDCPVRGHPPPTVEWLKNGERLDLQRLRPRVKATDGDLITNEVTYDTAGMNYHRLIISSLKVTDSAVYECIAVNRAGEDRIKINLHVHVPANIARSSLLSLHNNEKAPELLLSVLVNQSRTFDCDMHGIPAPTITWFRDGNLLATFSPSQQMSLQIDSAQTVDSAPRMMSENDVEFLKEGRQLKVKHVSADDTGSVYQCRVENAAGHDEIMYKLNVVVPPEIDPLLSSPTDSEFLVNDIATLRCVVSSGHPAPNISWSTNDRPIDWTDQRFSLSRDGSRLNIHDLQVYDTGLYTCTATNTARSKHRNFQLTALVASYMDMEMTGTIQMKVVRGKIAVLNCPAQGIPTPLITWFKNVQSTGEMTEVISDDRVRVLQNGRQLELSMTSEKDTAVYSCFANNSAGSATLNFNLSVIVAPSLDDSNVVPSPQVLINKTATLECPVEGVPPPQVQWLKNNRPVSIRPGVRLLNNGRHLEIFKTQINDTGTYTCLATNDGGELRKDYQLLVVVPPTMANSGKVEITELIEKSTLYLTCPATGSPPPSIIWYKNNVPFLDAPPSNVREMDGGYRLELRSVSASDDGTYKCQANNIGGQKAKTFKVKVIEKPRIVGSQTTVNISVKEYSPVQMDCDVSKHTPDTRLTWMRDGILLNSLRAGLLGNGNTLGHVIRVLRGGRQLQLSSALVGQAGVYTCTAENIAGDDQKTFELQVIATPRISGSRDVDELSVVMDHSITLDCHITSGNPPPSVQWIKESEAGVSQVVIESDSTMWRLEDGGQRLHIASAQLTDDGRWTCEASNAAGAARKDFLLNVLVKPTIEESPAEVEAIAGSQATLHCDALGLPKPTVAWKKGGHSLITTELRKVEVHETGALQFLSVHVDDAGMYRCEAKNEAGTVTKDYTLSVNVPPEIMNANQQRELSVTIGDAVNLDCLASGVPKPRVLWQKGTSVLSATRGYEIFANNTLRIPSVEMSSSGVYICVAQNNAGTATRSINLNVIVPPMIEEQDTEHTVVQDREIILPCRVSGVPTPEVEWRKDGVKISPNDFYYRILQSNFLAIPVVRMEDGGIYTCAASNDAGTASSDTKLTVHVVPSIDDSERHVTATRGDSARFTCTSTGHPQPITTWIQDGRTLLLHGGRYEVDSSGTLIINDVQTTDGGFYMCSVRNEAGRSTANFSLAVQVPPVITIPPKDLQVRMNERIELECVSEGTPQPQISWRINNTVVPSFNGRNVLIIPSALKSDDGTYMCIAENSAGTARARAAVKVKVAPRVLVHDDNQAVSLSEKVLLDCPIDGGAEPAPEILWLKDKQPVELTNRIHQLRNGSLVIYESSDTDAGLYECLASNEAGSSTGITHLTVRKAPQLLVKPRDVVVEVGFGATIDCVVSSQPEAEIIWLTDDEQLSFDDRILKLTNNSLRINYAQLTDNGTYTCQARNNLGSVEASAELTVQVNGYWSPWLSWSRCSESCGEGTRTRSRRCDSPEPTNGGRMCSGMSTDTRSCFDADCPVDGGWGSWTSWEQCSRSCGAGRTVRTRNCDSPYPSHGGRTCSEEEAIDYDDCDIRPCPIDGGWSTWSDWKSCSETCGQGVQERYRQCDNPRPDYGGDTCIGGDSQRQPCYLARCPVHGGWGSWGDWSFCTQSCGGTGSQSQRRLCDSPPPSSGGRSCLGADVQSRQCNLENCPVESEWLAWSSWGAVGGECSRSCGGGLWKRFRTCHDPSPGRQPCRGQAHETQTCNEHMCPVDGVFGPWTSWTECSKTCGSGGQQERWRDCTSPLHGGQDCSGRTRETKDCIIPPCTDLYPYQAMANLVGNVNSHDFGVSKIFANISRTVRGDSRISAVVMDIPPLAAHQMHYLVSFLTPIYWTTSAVQGHAVNGYSLTYGAFTKESQVEFASGEVLRMTHIGRGVDSNGVFQVDIIANGAVPKLPETAKIVVLPYFEDYVQTGPGSIYGYSSQVIRVDGHTLPYAWNHSVTYGHTLGRMPFLVQRLKADDLFIDFDLSRQLLRYQLTTSMSRGEPSNECPPGFSLSIDGLYCQDQDECSHSHTPCSHQCINTPGSFQCVCPPGMLLASNGRICKDVDECDLQLANCQKSRHDCFNTVGSYRCLAKCSAGYRRAVPGQELCEDINECLEGSKRQLCEHDCINSDGSYRCVCKSGYKSVGKTKCEDVNECKMKTDNCSHICDNTRGGFRCRCNPGYKPDDQYNNSCVDIDECLEDPRDACPSGQSCINSVGSYLCLHLCPTGYITSSSSSSSSNGIKSNEISSKDQSCIDIDECMLGLDKCQYGQTCINTNGSYACSCPRGFKAALVGQSCVDIDECRVPIGQCQHKCRNTVGSFQCYCPPGYRLSNNKRTCQDLDECSEQSINCGPNKRCFNRRGDFECVDTTCPVDYELDPNNGFCVLDCERARSNPACRNYRQTGAYRQNVEFHLVSLPSGIAAHQDILRLMIFQNDVQLTSTNFTLIHPTGSTQRSHAQLGELTGVTNGENENLDRKHFRNKYERNAAFSNQQNGGVSHDVIVTDSDPISGESVSNADVTSDFDLPFGIRTENGNGFVYTLRTLVDRQSYRLRVEGAAYGDRYDGSRNYRAVQYNSTFIIYISISSYPY